MTYGMHTVGLNLLISSLPLNYKDVSIKLAQVESLLVCTQGL